VSRTDLLLLAAAVGVAAAAVAYRRRSTPAVATSSGGFVFGSAADLPDPNGLPIGTQRGAYVVRSQSRQAGAGHYWSLESGGFLG
jgi:hypothetical protein